MLPDDEMQGAFSAGKQTGIIIKNMADFVISARPITGALFCAEKQKIPRSVSLLTQDDRQPLYSKNTDRNTTKIDRKKNIMCI